MVEQRLELKLKAIPRVLDSVAVIGAGQMGSGIAQVFAQSGYKTVLLDQTPQALERGYNGILNMLARLVEKGKISQAQKETVSGNLTTATNLEACQSVGLVVEAIIENIDIKTKLFAELDVICKPGTILASNTSSIAITKLAAATKRPDRVIGMHFMNPVPLMKLVEIIRGMQTSDETYKSVCDITEHLEKTPVTARHDYAGFIVNRMLVPMLNEAFFALMEGVATAEEIDTAMKLGTNMPMGPLQLADFIGLDTLLSICRIFQSEFGDSKYRPCPLLVKYVEAGWLGKKSGRGVFTYT